MWVVLFFFFNLAGRFRFLSLFICLPFLDTFFYKGFVAIVISVIITIMIIMVMILMMIAISTTIPTSTTIITMIIITNYCIIIFIFSIIVIVFLFLVSTPSHMYVYIHVRMHMCTHEQHPCARISIHATCKRLSTILYLLYAIFIIAATVSVTICSLDMPPCKLKSFLANCRS